MYGHLIVAIYGHLTVAAWCGLLLV